MAKYLLENGYGKMKMIKNRLKYDLIFDFNSLIGKHIKTIENNHLINKKIWRNVKNRLFDINWFQWHE